MAESPAATVTEATRTRPEDDPSQSASAVTVAPVELGRRLRQARKSWKLTQADAAEALGVSRSAVSEMETGRRGVSGLELHRLAHLYGRDMADFLEAEFDQGGAIVALFRQHSNLAFDGCALEALRRCIALGREAVNLERRLGRSRASIKAPAYSGSPLGSRWAAVEEGSAVAVAERQRLGLEGGPLPDVASILESQGVRTALVDFPNGVSGLVLMDRRNGFLVAANGSHDGLRRRFSFAHEYAHILFDRRAEGLVSLADARDDLREVRANAFAAAFLMPDSAVRSFVAGLAKGRPSRMQAVVYDGDEALPVTVRSNRQSQRLHLHDIVLLAHHFVVSCPAILYRLRSLGLVTESERSVMADQHKRGLSRELRPLLGLVDPNDTGERNRFQGRFVNLALEAFRREAITRRKLEELVRLASKGMAEIPSAYLNSFQEQE